MFSTVIDMIESGEIACPSSEEYWQIGNPEDSSGYYKSMRVLTIWEYSPTYGDIRFSPVTYSVFKDQRGIVLSMATSGSHYSTCGLRLTGKAAEKAAAWF